MLILLCSSIGWGLTWLPLHYFADAGLQGPLLIFIAFTSASLCLLPVLLRQKMRWMGQRHLLLLIVLLGGLANLAFQAALFYGDVVRVMILFYMLPVWSVLGGRIFLGESIDALRLLTLAAALSGGFLILGGPEIFSRPPDLIDLVAIISGFAFSMNNLVFRFAQSIPLPSKVASMFIGGAMLTGLFLLFTRQSMAMTDAKTGLLAVFYGIGWLTLITFGTQWGVTRLEAGRAAIIMVMELVAAVISTIIILGQSLSGAELAGAILVTVAALLEGFRGDQDVPVRECVETDG